MRYEIDRFVTSTRRYFLVIQFDKVDGGTFNHYARMTDEKAIMSPAGKLTVAYALKHIWDRHELTKPIVVRFYVVERSGEAWRIIGKSEPIQYADR